MVPIRVEHTAVGSEILIVSVVRLAIRGTNLAYSPYVLRINTQSGQGYGVARDAIHRDGIRPVFRCGILHVLHAIQTTFLFADPSKGSMSGVNIHRLQIVRRTCRLAFLQADIIHVEIAVVHLTEGDVLTFSACQRHGELLEVAQMSRVVVHHCAGTQVLSGKAVLYRIQCHEGGVIIRVGHSTYCHFLRIGSTLQITYRLHLARAVCLGGLVEATPVELNLGGVVFHVQQRQYRIHLIVSAGAIQAECAVAIERVAYFRGVEYDGRVIRLVGGAGGIIRVVCDTYLPALRSLIRRIACGGRGGPLEGESVSHTLSGTTAVDIACTGLKAIRIAVAVLGTTGGGNDHTVAQRTPRVKGVRRRILHVEGIHSVVHQSAHLARSAIYAGDGVNSRCGCILQVRHEVVHHAVNHIDGIFACGIAFPRNSNAGVFHIHARDER